MPLVISTEDLNRYGYRILTAGIETAAYEKNPVLCWDHATYGRLPIGKIENLRKENGRLMGDPVFDEEDEFAAAAKRKYEKGMLNACSMGIEVMQTSVEGATLVQGQTRATVTRCELEEVSMVVVPANRSAVRLSANQELDQAVPVINQTESEMKLDKIAQALGLNADASEEAILNTIQKLSADKGTAEQELTKLRDARRKALLSVAKEKGLLTDANREQVEALAAANLDAFAAMVEAMPAPKPVDEKPAATILSAIKPGQSNGKDEGKGDDGAEEFEKMSAEQLLSLKKKDPARYAELAAAYKGRAFA